MRIVSESRRIDVPYESYTIRIEDGCIIAQRSPTDYGYKLAEPDTLKQAEAAMDLIRESYQREAKVIYMDYIIEEVREEC